MKKKMKTDMETTDTSAIGQTLTTDRTLSPTGTRNNLTIGEPAQ